MDRRWLVVGAFVGITALVAVWALAGSEPNQRRNRPRKPEIAATVKVDPEAFERVDAKQRLRAERIKPLDPEMLEKVRNTKNRLQMPVEQAPVPAGGPYPLDQDGIAAAVKERKVDLQACYDTARFHTPGLAGTLTLVLAVASEPGAEEGHIQSVDVESDLDATVFEGCVSTVFQELRFQTGDPVTVRYPVTFTEAEPSEGGNP